MFRGLLSCNSWASLIVGLLTCKADQARPKRVCMAVISRFGELHRMFGMFALVIALVLTADLAATAETIPLPRTRPDLSSVDRTGKAGSQAKSSSCQLRLSELADFKAAPSITGPGECTATDVVTLEAVLLSDKNRVVLSPAAMLRCPMAEAVARWTRDDVAPSLSSEGASLRGIENSQFI